MSSKKSTPLTETKEHHKQYSVDSLISANLKINIRSIKDAIPPTIAQIKTLLEGYICSNSLQKIVLAIDEIIRNAYEHGSLEITNQEKKEAIENETFELLLNTREKIHSHRTIAIKCLIENKILTFTVHDQGNGFDWETATKESKTMPVDTNNLHGRGLFVIQKVFDTVSYNECGNIITATKKLI